MAKSKPEDPGREDGIDDWFDDEDEELDDEECEREQEPLDLGDTSGGREVVCHGDEELDQIVPWLGSLVDTDSEYRAIAEEHGLALDGLGLPDSTEAFLEAIGVDLESEFWEGSMISGYYCYGWITVGSSERVKSRGWRILRKSERSLRRALLKKAQEKLRAIEELDCLSQWVSADPVALQERIKVLESDLKAAVQARDEALRQNRP